jgi:hypothetical protein
MYNLFSGVVIIGMVLGVIFLGPLVISAIGFVFTYCIVPAIILWGIGKSFNMGRDKLRDKFSKPKTTSSNTIYLLGGNI